MLPHFVLLIHGIGDFKKTGFSRHLPEAIRSAFEAEATRILGARPADRPDTEEVWWSDITQDDQNRLWSRLFPRLGRKSLSIWSWLRAPWTWMPRLRYWAPVREFVVNYLGDPIAYVESPGTNKYKLIHERVMSYVGSCANNARSRGATAERPALLTVVAHSLGSVIASDLYYDVKNHGRAWPAEIRFANFVTLGSPLAIYALRYGLEPRAGATGPLPFSNPIRMDDPDGLWMNIFDPQDVLGYPLKTLNDAYNRAVFADKLINAGQWWNLKHAFFHWNPLSHTLYWDGRTVAKIVGRKVALDWLRENHPELGPRLRQEYVDYQSWVTNG